MWLNNFLQTILDDCQSSWLWPCVGTIIILMPQNGCSKDLLVVLHVAPEVVFLLTQMKSFLLIDIKWITQSEHDMV